MTESINCDLARQDQRWMNTRRVREELVLRIQNGGLTTQQDTEKRCESFLIWPIFDRNFNLQMGKSLNSSFNFMFFHDPRRSESIRVDPTRTGGPSWSGPTFVPAYFVECTIIIIMASTRKEKRGLFVFNCCWEEDITSTNVQFYIEIYFQCERIFSSWRTTISAEEHLQQPKTSSPEEYLSLLI